MEADDAGKAEAHTYERLSELLGRVEAMSVWYGQVRSMPRPMLVRFLKMGSKLRKLLGG